MKVLRTLLMGCLVLALVPLWAAESDSPVTADAALRMLREGNERFARDGVLHPRSGVERRVHLTKAQHPFATVLACSDSRVPVETVLDQGLGDLFTVRVAGNVAAGDEVVGSLEYGVLHAGTRLVLVLGHEGCGAVKAALAGGEEPGTSIGGLLEHVAPAAASAKDKLHSLEGSDLVDTAVERNVLNSMRDLLKASPRIAGGVRAHKLKVVGGVYNLHTGRIQWLGEHPKQREILAPK